jgi:hypothetical protein
MSRGSLGLRGDADVGRSATWVQHVYELRWLARNIVFMRYPTREWAKGAEDEKWGVSHFVMQNGFVSWGGFAVIKVFSADVWGFAAGALERCVRWVGDWKTQSALGRQ